MINVATATVHAISTAEVYTHLGAIPAGLTQTESADRLERYGHNVISEAQGIPLIVKLAANFTHLMALLLWAGGIIALIGQMPQLAIAIWMVNIINGAFSFWQEFKAEKATEALKRMLPVYARVLRDGIEQQISAEDLVPGDVLLLNEGDHVSADARLVQESELRIDQSTLSGESHPVAKSAVPMNLTNIARTELANLVFAGTSVASGTGKAVVFATGMQTEFGKIAHLTQSMGDDLSPLQQEMERVTRTVTVIAVGVGAVFFGLSLLVAGMQLTEAFIFALGMIVAFVPEGMLPTVTLALALGVQRMAKRNALVKRLSSVETLGCTTVICTDKTGTLTQNEMTVRSLWLNGQHFAVTGGGYAPSGEIQQDGHACNLAETPGLRDLLLAAGLCNNARLLPLDSSKDNPKWEILGDPTEAALKVAAAKGGLELDQEIQHSPRMRELPFDSRRKRMTTVHLVGRDYIAYTKGAPKEVLALCTSMIVNGQPQPLSDALRVQIMTANDEDARNGLRVLAVAQRQFAENPLKLEGDTIEADLTFLGLIGMMDPPRIEVSQAVERCYHAGIRVIMITGDYGLTAESIARRIGIVRGEHPRIITGAELDMLDDQTLKDALKDEVIFARVAPEHKMRVVSILQALGQIVAVTGDGVNDAPALKKANIGVAMGKAGTDVAKEAADMILTDDNFASIVNAVEEGRAVYSNIKKFTTYVFTSNSAEAIPFALLAFSAGRIPLPLTVMQVLAVDLGTDMFPALALGAEPPEPGLMDHPPRKLTDHVITFGLVARALLFLGLIQGAVGIIAFYFHYWTNGYAGQWLDLPADGTLYRAATAMTFAGIVITQIGNLFAQRTERETILRMPLFNNRLIWVGIGIEVALMLSIVYVPFMQSIFNTAAFPLHNWLFLILFTPLLIVVDEVRKAWVRRQASHNNLRKENPS